MRVPQGSYLWEVWDQYWTTMHGLKTLDGKTLDVVLPSIRLPDAFVARNRGKPAPDWIITDARGVPADKRQPRGFRGEWLIVEFWGYW